MIGAFFTLSSIVYISIFTFYFFSKKSVKNIETTIYKMLIITTLLGLILDASGFITYANGIDPESFPYKLLAKATLIYFVAWVLEFFYYIFVITINSKNKKNVRLKDLYKKAFRIGLMTFLILVTVILILPIEFNNNNGAITPIGASVFVTYAVAGICLLLCVILTLTNIKNIVSKKYLPLFALIFLLIVMTIIQNVFPDLFLINFALSILVVILYFTIENPDLKLLREIQESKELAEQANKEKAMFLYDLAQDIKLPVKAIASKCDELVSEKDVDILVNGIKDIKFSTKKLSSSIDGILDTSNIKKANIEVAHVKYNINNLLHEITIKTKSDLKDKNIDFRSDFDVNIPDYLYGDSIRLKQILSIIIENAIKHTEKGFIEFNVSSIIKNDICRLMITVEDSGKGIESRKLETLFYLSEENLSDEERITKLTTTKENLSVIKLLTTVIGGTVIVNSALGKGTKFTIVLDQEICESEKSATMKMVETLKSNKRVLLVNNEEYDIKILSKILDKYEITIDVVEWGQECLEKIRRKEKYDYILLDEEMPKLNGIKTFEKLKLENNFDIPVILLVEKHHIEHKKRYLNSGFIDIIAKPYKKENVTKVLDKYLK